MIRKSVRVKDDGKRVATCSACGAETVRGSAKYCLVCGKLLSEDYQPLDAIRSSYGLQRTSLAAADSSRAESLFDEEEPNPASHLAWACFVYSLVPYLGILFVPLTFAIGGAGYFAASRRPEIGGARVSFISMGLSVPVLAVQIFLWWLLYIIPEIGGVI